MIKKIILSFITQSINKAHYNLEGVEEFIVNNIIKIHQWLNELQHEMNIVYIEEPEDSVASFTKIIRENKDYLHRIGTT